MMQILNHSKSAGLLNIIEGTDPMIILVTPNGSLQKYNCSTGVVSVLSNEMPSDVNDPDRLNLIDIRERHPVSTSDLLRYQENINKGILNSIIK